MTWASDTLTGAEGALLAEKYSVVLATLERLDVNEANEPRARFLKGTALAGIGRLDEAAAILEKLIVDQPRMPEVMNNLAMVYARQGKSTQAKQLLERAIRLEDRYATIHDNLNAVYEGMARTSYAKALRIESATPSTRLELMHALAVEALPTAQSAVRAAPVTERIEVAANELAPVAKVRSEPKVVVAAAESVNSTKVVPLPESAAVATAVVVAEAKPVQAAVPAQAKPPVPSAVPLEELLAARLSEWAAAWSAQDVERYLSFYDPEFSPARGVAHDDWMAERRERLRKPEWIKVTLDGIQVRSRGEGLADVTLTQHYDAPGYSDSSVKRIRLALRDGKWLIVSEATLSAGRR